DEWLNGKYQESYNNWFEQNLGLRSYFVRSYNQILFTLFNKGDQNRYDPIVIGNEGQLFEKSYINEYFIDEPLDFAKIEDTVKKVKELQELLAQSNVNLFINICPSKAAIYPEFVPNKYKQMEIKKRRDYDNFILLANKHGINYVDGHSVMLQKKEEIEHPLFPRGGIHWNELGAFYSAKEIINKMEKVSGKGLTDIYYEEPVIYTHPTGSDRDLADLLNVWYPPTDYKVPNITIKNEAKPDQFKPNVLFIGDSFNWLLLDIFNQNNIFSGLNFYYYFNKDIEYPSRKEMILNLNDFDWEQDVLSRDFIVLSMTERSITGIGNGFIEEALLYFKFKNDKSDTLNDIAYKAEIAIDIEDEIIYAKPNSQLKLIARIKNISNTSWPSSEPINLGNHWLDLDAKVLVNDDVRSEISKSLMPGMEIEVPITVNIPEFSGQYILELDMVHEGVTWFKSHGSTTVQIPVVVSDT
ncbi:MAG: alginate O-acetyltransferase AlgX-related protein, partial [Peptococcales bacterium]